MRIKWCRFYTKDNSKIYKINSYKIYQDYYKLYLIRYADL